MTKRSILLHPWKSRSTLIFDRGEQMMIMVFLAALYICIIAVMVAAGWIA